MFIILFLKQMQKYNIFKFLSGNTFNFKILLLIFGYVTVFNYLPIDNIEWGIPLNRFMGIQ